MQLTVILGLVQGRAGGNLLSLIGKPLCAPILRAHLDGPLRLPDLRERVGGAAQTTLRVQIDHLRDIGALERHVRNGMPYTVENELTEVGRSILAVTSIVEDWLARAPQGAIALDSESAKGAIRSLVAGWDSAVLRTLADRPLSLTELSSVIGDHSYPALERRLSALRAVRLVEPRPDSSRRDKPYGVTSWARQAVQPLIAAGRCECVYLPYKVERLAELDIEAAFLLGVPLVDLHANRSGSCVLAIDAEAPGDISTNRLRGVHVEVKKGAVTSRSSSHEDEEPETWALGTAEAWIDAILEGRLDQLRFGGRDPDLARAVAGGLHAS
jgi:DNA-binding HxlR family transcriptional regulator